MTMRVGVLQHRLRPRLEVPRAAGDGVGWGEFRALCRVTTPVDAPCRTTSDVGLGRAPLRRSVFDLLTSLVTSLVLSHLSHVSNRIREISSFS